MSSKHDSILTHVSGKSTFIDDMPFHSNEVVLGLVLSKCAHANIKIKNLAKIKALNGIVDVFTANDFSYNKWGTIFQDQPLLAEKQVSYAGEAIAIIAATSQESLNIAKQLFEVQYKKLPAVLSIKQARKEKSFIASERKIERGDISTAFKNASLVFEDEIVIEGAEHFYLEAQACICYPEDGGQLKIYSSTQHPTEVQHVVSHALNLSSKDVVVIVPRMGGGFGGKESQSSPIAAYAALACQKLGRPCRLVLEREEDMQFTGKRNPFHNEYKVAYDESGKILALDIKLFSDAGAYADLSTSIMERAMLHSDNAYYIPNMRVRGQVCKTHHHPHTAFRGFGGPKGVLSIEKIIEQIAYRLNKDSLEIRKLNCYQKGALTTHYGQKLENNMLPQLFDLCEKSFSYQNRRKAIELDNKNKNSRYVRGLSMTPVKFGISFTTRFLNQGNALINLYRDGSIQISTGATEMGQGVYRRISQIVSEEFGLSSDQVRVMATSTEKNANTSPTAASSGTDINAAAAAVACQKIKARLSALAIKLFDLPKEKWAATTAALGNQPEVEVEANADIQNLLKKSEFFGVEFKNGKVYLTSKPKNKINFIELCNEAYLNRVSLCEYAHYRIPGIYFDKLKGQGNAFYYFTQGVAATEVQIDKLTGELKVLACDIQMDLGRPVNKELDYGQIQGAFVQGMGWMTIEKLSYQEGVLKSIGPSTYKIPSVHDIPRDWNVNIIDNKENLCNIRGSKAVGEPPLLLACSVWTAIQNALSYATDEYPDIKVPATAERIIEKLHAKQYKMFQDM